jgi:hypothetical protein
LKQKSTNYNVIAQMLPKNEFQAYETKLNFIRSKLAAAGRKVGAFPQLNTSGAAEDGEYCLLFFQ